MSRALFLLLPALVLQAQDSAIPGAVEVRPGVFVLRGVPNEETCLAMKRERLNQVIDLRRDGEPGLNSNWESSRLQELNIQYLRYAIGTKPPASDFDFLRTLLKDLPRGTRVLIHCGDGNRAAAVACTWLVLEKGVPLETALKTARGAGLRLPETEGALRAYLTRTG